MSAFFVEWVCLFLYELISNNTGNIAYTRNMTHGVHKTHDDDKNATEKTKKMSNTKDIRQYGPHQTQVVNPGAP